MLILTRKTNEKVIINNNIEIVIVAVKGERVRLGINAPDDVPVHREEVAKKIELNATLGKV
jgi:carbon storage regulator